MRVWLDLSNSPHVALFGPIVEHLHARGDDVLISARDHAQTRALAERAWPDLVVVGGESPPGRAAKAATIARRAGALARFAAGRHVDVALSHGSYAQIAAARSLRIPAVTMMDYEYQPANHLSFRLAERVVVPEAFPDEALRRFGATRRTLRYAGFKEEVYLAGFAPDTRVLDGVDPSAVVVVLRPPPNGALYHRMVNVRFEEIASAVRATPGVRCIELSRGAHTAVDGPSLVALADLTIGAGGTMNRESALLGTPTYTVFAGNLAAVDAALIAAGRLVDLREPGTAPRVEKAPASRSGVPLERRDAILAVVDEALASVRRRHVVQRPRRNARDDLARVDVP